MQEQQRIIMRFCAENEVVLKDRGLIKTALIFGVASMA